MSNNEITDEQVREKAAEIQEHAERWKKIGGLEDPATQLDVEALARGVLELRARPRLSEQDVLRAVRPQWERKAEQQGLTGEARETFIRENLDSDAPQIFCEALTVIGLTYAYSIHFNKAAAELVDVQTETVLQALEVAILALPELDDYLALVKAYIEVEATTIKAVAMSQDNGQVQLVGLPPILIAEADDTIWGVGGLFDHLG